MALRRSVSADSILIAASYVSSPQLSLHTYCGQMMMDRSSQTPQEWEEIDRRKHERKINDHSAIIKMSKSKQRTSSRTSKNSSAGRDETNGNSLSPTSSPSSSINASPLHLPKQELSGTAAVSTTTISTTIPKSGPIAIPNKLALELSNYRGGNSVEELNQEIESLVLKGISDKVGDRIPEGHRAPVVELLYLRRMKSAKTQTFNRDIIDYNQDNDHCHGDVSSGDSCPSSDNSRSESPVSPSLSRSSSADPVVVNESNHVDYSSSPKINKFLTREPPDGCEKVKIVNEDVRKVNLNDTLLAPRPLKPSAGFVLLPSRSSAFLPIPKSNYINSVSPMDSIKNEINKFK